jgi:L-alanine-DL-glutamate epimerase-like enolase superfamily enzyme
MLVDRVEWYPRELPRKEPFATAQHVSDVAHVVFVRVDAGGLEGWGAASPSDVTDESTATVLEALPKIADGLRGFTFERGREVADRMDAILAGNPSAKAAIDLAAFDLLGKAKGVPVHELLGHARDFVMTDRTVGLMDAEEGVKRGRSYVAEGFHALKIKLAGRADEDVARVKSMRESVGNHILLRTDANQAYTYRHALHFSRQAYPLVIEFFEQPLAADDLEGMRNLTEASPIAVMADESVVSPHDAAKVAWAKCARLVNLKLMKTGGIARALEANAICESAGLPTMLGCNAESSLSIAAAAHMARSQQNVRFADLDSHFNLAGDPATGLALEDGYLKVSGKPGLGMDVRL